MLACSFHVSPEVFISKIFFLKYISIQISTLNLSTSANVKSRTAFVFVSF